jgi:hypothetical protein
MLNYFNKFFIAYQKVVPLTIPHSLNENQGKKRDLMALKNPTPRSGNRVFGI